MKETVNLADHTFRIQVRQLNLLNNTIIWEARIQTLHEDGWTQTGHTVQAISLKQAIWQVKQEHAQAQPWQTVEHNIPLPQEQDTYHWTNSTVIRKNSQQIIQATHQGTAQTLEQAINQTTAAWPNNP